MVTILTCAWRGWCSLKLTPLEASPCFEPVVYYWLSWEVNLGWRCRHPPTGREANPSRAIMVVAPVLVHAMVPLLQLQGRGKDIMAGSVYPARGAFLGSVRCTMMAHTVWMWCQYGGTSLTRTKLMAGLFISPKMSRVATPPLMAAASLCDFEWQQMKGLHYSLSLELYICVSSLLNQ